MLYRMEVLLEDGTIANIALDCDGHWQLSTDWIFWFVKDTGRSVARRFMREGQYQIVDIYQMGEDDLLDWSYHMS